MGSTTKEITAGGGINFINAKKLLENGTTGLVLKGIYLGAVENRFGNLDYKFSNEQGEEVMVNGVGSLKAKLDQVEPGTVCLLSYNGQKTLESGSFKGRPFHDFTVEVIVDEEESA